MANKHKDHVVSLHNYVIRTLEEKKKKLNQNFDTAYLKHPR